MAKENENKDEKKGRLDIMTLIILGLSAYLFFLCVKWLFFMD